MAQSSLGATRGNILIYGMDVPEDKKSSDVQDKSQSHLIEDKKDEVKDTVSTDYKEMTFEEDEATIIYHFFRNKDLRTIGEQYSGLIKRLPPQGQVKFLIIRYKKIYERDITLHIDKMRVQIKDLQRKDLTFKPENSSKLEEFLKQPERSEDPVCYISDFVKRRVDIVGQTYEDIGEADHKLKFYLGEVRATGSRRQGRKMSDSEIDFDSSTNQTASYADVTKYSKSGMTAGDKSRRFIRSFSSSGAASSAYGSSSDDDFSFQTTLNNGFVLKVYKASITKLQVDVIVNAANENMMHGGGVARVISEAAGWELDDESAEYVRRNGNLNVAENIVTTAGNLRQYRGVIHAVGPVWYQYRDKMTCLDDLGDCVYNVLETCQKRSYRTVAMSAISAGIFAVPKELCADMYVDAAARFSKNLEPGDCPRELHIIDIDNSILKLVEVSVKKWHKDPHSINARITLPKFLEDNPHLAGLSSSNSDSSYGHHRGQRRQGHGGGGQNFYKAQGQRRDRENNTAGQTSSSADGVSNKHNLTKTLRWEKEERFRWGGRAKVYKMDEKITVKIFKGEISKAQNMDAVVCSMDKEFKCTGFIATTLRTAGGEAYVNSFKEKERKRRTFVQKGSVIKCKAGNLGVDYVMHVVMDKLMDAKPEETKMYQGLIYTTLNKADEWMFPKLVIPLFGTGLIQTNEGKLKSCCIAVLKGIDEYLCDSRDKGKVTDIHLVNNNDLVNKTLIEVFDEGVNLPSTFGNRSLQESHGGNRKQNENRSGRSFQESGGGYSGRRQNESKNDGRSPNRHRKSWESFDDDSDGNDRNRQGKKQFENSHRGRGTASESSDKTHSSGQSIRGAARNTATPESCSNEESADEPKRPPVTPQKEEKPTGGNLMIIEN